MKLIITTVCFLLITNSFSQTLFTYGNKAVSKQTFLQSYKKNNTGNNSASTLKNYLQLFINYKLKIQAAIDEGLNTEPSVNADAQQFKNEIAENIINKQANINALVKQAYERSKKEILLAQVFVEYRNNYSATDFKQIQTAYNQLKTGKNFDAVTQIYSTDGNIKKSNGILGYITAFSLPYEIENIVYALKPKTFSNIYIGKFGYHIFYIKNERTARPARKIAQIFFSFPPNANENDKSKIIQKANKIFELLKTKVVFDSVAKQYSDDNTNALLEVSTGKFDANFEEAVFALQNIGNISAPIVSDDGVRIVQLKEIVVLPQTLNEAIAINNLKQKVENSNRLTIAKQKLLPKWMKQTNYKKATYNEKELFRYIDSFVLNKTFQSFKTITDSTVIFSTQKQKWYVIDFCLYVKLNSERKKDYSTLLKEFIEQKISNYYKQHLEDYNAEMKEQVKEFTEANLLFAVMDKHVWGNASKDTIALKEYYTQHAAQYIWQPSTAAIIVTANNATSANDALAKIKANPSNWRNITSSYGSLLNADSGRFENNQLPFTIENKKENSTTTIHVTNNPELYTFFYITHIYNNAELRNFNDAKSLVAADYQQVLENKWLQQLKIKYPVKINNTVWKSIEHN
ncbi:MAG: peptidylprolyl isomerase [Bacteroidetes bacterium]|nr:peptidylprolyl isomerase [Bacteroidota bacterium]MBS1648966.1 peptidylprolyl isomerase [Bacteroidota bacterium]